MAFLKKSVSTGLLALVLFVSLPVAAAGREGREPRERDPIFRIIKKIVRLLVPAPQDDSAIPPKP